MSQQLLLGEESRYSQLALRILHYTHFAYPIVLLLVFLVAFVAHSIITSPNRSVSTRTNITGPGGKPLPPTSRPPSNGPAVQKNEGFGRTRSLLFCWLNIGIILTFIGNTVNIVVHAISQRASGWWAGEAAVVCLTDHSDHERKLTQ